MAISIVEAERLNHPEIEEEVLQLEKLIDYNIKKHYPKQIPPIRFNSSVPTEVVRRVREIYMAGGWIVNLVRRDEEDNGHRYLQIINPERPY